MGERILIVGVNWLGDAVMSMPAIQAFRDAHPDAHLTVLTKPALAPLWRLHHAPDDIVTLRSSFEGTFSTASVLRGFGFARCFILPHSFRSAVIPWLARIPVRVGLPGHHRDFLLTSTVPLPAGVETMHQQQEIATLLGIGRDGGLPLPHIDPTEAARQNARRLAPDAGGPIVALIPGAARGPSKRWPEQHFTELGRRLSSEAGAMILVLGTPSERELGERMCRSIPRAINLAGATDLDTFAALLALSDVVVCNDSGGMHLAAAVGTPAVAIFGMTDPVKTGPLGKGHRVLRASGEGSRDIGRSSVAAEKALQSLAPDTVLKAVLATLEERRHA